MPAPPSPAPGDPDRQSSPSPAVPGEPERGPGPTPRLELLTRRDCHLCDEMEALLAAVLPARGLAYTTVDVDADADPALRQRFGNTVPVLLRDGHPVAKVRLDEPTLLRILARRR
jgi:glutaredoxin